MDRLDRAWMFVLVLITVYSKSVSGSPRMPDNLKVNACDGQVTAVWDPSMDASEARYSVQMANFYDGWKNVSSCTKILTTLCDLTSLIPDFRVAYRVRVHTMTANGVSEWAVIKKFLINDREPCPPSFTLSATSSSLTVRVDKKPVLMKLFPYGMTYTIYLDESGKDNETTIAYLNDDTDISEGETRTFSSLHWGREYCVRLRVQSNTDIRVSNASAPQCCRLPDREWSMLTVTWLSIFAVLTVLAVIMCVCSFVRRPEKTPVALKCPKTGWTPLTVEEGTMEVVTDKGWFLSMPKATDKNSWVNKEPVPLHAGEQEAEWKSERRTSLDSGVSVGSNSLMKTERGSDPVSICASIEGSQGTGSFSSAVEESHPQDGRTQAPSTEGKPADLGVCGLKGSKLYCLSDSEGQDSGFPPEGTHLTTDQYQRQSSPSLEALKEIHIDPDGAPVGGVTGYQKGSLWCAWQTNQGPWQHGPEEAGGDGSAELSEGALPFSTNYRRKTHVEMETVVSVDDSESPCDRPHMSLEEASPLLFLPLTGLPLAGDLGLSLNMVSISLCDVELWNE